MIVVHGLSGYTLRHFWRSPKMCLAGYDRVVFKNHRRSKKAKILAFCDGKQVPDRRWEIDYFKK
jgi:hypothetical protein